MAVGDGCVTGHGPYGADGCVGFMVGRISPERAGAASVEDTLERRSEDVKK